jgi:filamentous hemagglutinin family protein
MKKAISSFAFVKGQKRGSRLLASTALTAAGLMALTSPALAVDNLATPIGENVVGGAASFDRPQPGQLNIHQSTDRVIINWDSFNIGQGATTQFYQPGSGSLAVNRVMSKGSDPTQILGSLKANGRVMVLDRNGVFFGASSRLDVGGIIASTGDINDSAVMSGASKLDLGNFGDGSIVNNGLISAQDAGLVAFVGKNVANNGIINARVGKIALAAGDTTATIDLYGDGLVEFAVDGAKGKVLASNAGTINAEGGTVAITANAARDVVDNVINMDGIVNVSSVTMKGGKIILGGGKSGNVIVSGKAKADGQGGGDIKITGKNVAVTDTAELTANGGTNGNGGDIRVIGENAAIVRGKIKALGGTESGNGGFVEVSGYNSLNFLMGNVDTTAANGETGTLLIDPLDIAIIGGNGDGHDNGGAAGAGMIGGWQNLGTGNSGTIPFAEAGSPYNIYESEIEAQSATTNIIIQALRNITTSLGTSADGVVTLAANRNLTIETQNNSGNNGSINLTNLGFQVQGTGSMLITAATGTVGTGDVRVGRLLAENGNISVQTDNGQIYLENGAINVSGTGFVSFNASNRIFIDNDITTNGGNVTMEANRFTIDDTDAGSNNLDQIKTNGGNVRITANEVTLGETGGDPAAGEVLIDAGNGSILFERKTAGTIGLGGATGDTMLSDAELASLRAGELFIGSPVEGNNRVTAIYADSVDTTANITGKVTLSNYLNQTNGVLAPIPGAGLGAGPIDHNDLLFIGTNAFNGLTVNANDNIIFSNNSRVVSNADVILNADANAQSVGLLLMGSGSSVDTNGNDFTYNGHQALLGGSVIDAKGGDILFNNDDVFYTYTSNALRTSGAGTITLNQWDKNFTDPEGVWGNHDGSVQNAVNAIENTGTGLNTVIVGEGDYLESVTIAEDNFLIRSRLNYNVNPNTGVRGAESIIKPNSPGFLITGDNVEINGMLITGATDNGVHVEGGKNATIINNIIHDIDGDGIYAFEADGLTAQANEIYDIRTKGDNIGSGIHVVDTLGAQIGGTAAEANVIYDTQWDGVRTVGSTDMVIERNEIDNVVRTGIYLGNNTNSIVFGNYIDHAGRFGINADDGSTVTLTGNHIFDTGLDGIRLFSLVGTNIVDWNHIDSTGRNGVDAFDVAGLTIDRNFIGTHSVGPNINGDGIYGELVNGAVIKRNIIQNTTNPEPDRGSGVHIQKSTGVTVGGADPGDANQISDMGWDGIRLFQTTDATVEHNDILTVGRTGIYAGDTTGSKILRNKIEDVVRFGVNADDGSDMTITANIIRDTVIYGVRLFSLVGANLVDANYVDVTGSDGIYAFDVSGLTIDGNLIGTLGGPQNINGDGIYGEFVDGAVIKRNTITDTRSPEWNRGSGVHIQKSSRVTVGGPDRADANLISNMGWDGVRFYEVTNSTIENNDIDNVGRTGIYSGYGSMNDIIDNLIDLTVRYGINIDHGSFTDVTGNQIDGFGLDGIIYTNVSGENEIAGNEVDNAGAGYSGLKVAGPGNGTMTVSNNVFTDNETGATFESGLILLTGLANTFTGGQVGMRFDGGLVSLFDADGPVNSLPTEAPTNYGGTIGAQIFNGQSQYYVELLNGAFADTWVDGRDSSYDGFTPLTSILSPANYALLEPKFYDWNDDTGLGRFWGIVPPADAIEIDQQNIFEEFAAFSALGGQVSVVLLGLPRLSGGAAPAPFDPNAIEPAAGEETASLSPEELNNIQTAAGGEGAANSSCWIDASAAASGGTATFSFSSVVNQTTLAQDSSCGVTQPQ